MKKSKRKGSNQTFLFGGVITAAILGMIYLGQTGTFSGVFSDKSDDDTAVAAQSTQITRPNLKIQNVGKTKSVEGTTIIPVFSQHPIKVLEIQKKKSGTISWTTIGRIENVKNSPIVFNDSAIIAGSTYTYRVRATYLKDNKTVHTTNWSDTKSVSVPK